jgi:hypothetical protein
VTNRVWLASYPKSGNTWLRILIHCLDLDPGESLDINRLSIPIASARAPFEDATLIDSGILTRAEVESLRPRIHERPDPDMGDRGIPPPTQFIKTHDAYSLTPQGEPLLAGARGAKGAILIVRDPRDVVSSLASHKHIGLDEAVTFLDHPDAAFGVGSGGMPSHLHQQLGRWSDHVAGWLNQRDIAVHLVRFEDLQRNTARVLRDAMAFAGRTVTREQVEHAVQMANFNALQALEARTGFRETASKATVFFRRGQAGAWRDELTPRQTRDIELAHGPMMATIGYDLTFSPPPHRKVGQS